MSRPDKIGQAMMLLYVTLGIGVLRSIMEASRLPQGTSAGFAMFITFGVLGVMWFFIYMIGQGKNWARITFLVLFIIGIPFAVPPLLQSLAANPFSGLLGIAQAVIQILALTFLFQKPSSDWFGEMKGPAQLAAAPDTKKCPQCAEDIKAEARICRYCRHTFSEEDVTAAIQKVQSSAAAAAAERRPAETRLPSSDELFSLALAGDLDTLSTRAAALLSVFPKNPNGLYWRAFVEDRNGNDRAAELYRALSARTFFDVADLWKKKGRLEEAERTLITLRDTHPEETKRATKALSALR